MNWGSKIAIVLALFVVCMISMVVLAMRQSNDMVDHNYYEREMKYQEVINASNNLKDVQDGDIVFQDEKSIIIKFPTSIAGKGRAEFLKTDDKSKDVNIGFEPNEEGLAYLSKSFFNRGVYMARVSWSFADNPYYKEQQIFITK